MPLEIKNNIKIINDDHTINIVNVFVILFRNIGLIFRYGILFFVLTTLFNMYVSPKYESTASFFIPSSGSSQNLLSKYARLTGNGMADSIESKVSSLLESFYIQEKVFAEFKKQYPELTKKEIRGDLKLKKNISIQRDANDLFVLRYQHQNPETTKFVLEKYLDFLILFNEEFDLNSERDVISVLDKPRTFENPVYPNKMMNYIFAIILSFFISIFHIWIKVILIPFFKNVFNKTKQIK